jgi:mannose-6-phosphate isomerase-like protein (cupin superfamily)
MSEQQKYVINLDTKFSFLELIDIPKLVNACEEKWYNQTLTKVNDCVVRLGVFKEGEFHWHKHDNEDEFFLVLQGKLIIELEKDSVALEPQQGYTIPKGIIHRPKVQEPTVVVMVEGANVKPIGD